MITSDFKNIYKFPKPPSFGDQAKLLENKWQNVSVPYVNSRGSFKHVSYDDGLFEVHTELDDDDAYRIYYHKVGDWAVTPTGNNFVVLEAHMHCDTHYTSIDMDGELYHLKRVSFLHATPHNFKCVEFIGNYFWTDDVGEFARCIEIRDELLGLPSKIDDLVDFIRPVGMREELLPALRTFASDFKDKTNTELTKIFLRLLRREPWFTESKMK
jgi:hypothetical protein